jgi:pilus assembly protein Flp/PilA
MQRFLAKFLRDDSGATAIEYGLIAAGIALAIIAIINGIGLKLAPLADIDPRQRPPAIQFPHRLRRDCSSKLLATSILQMLARRL